MNILLIGSGGREDALAWKIKQSPLCTRLVCAPGNPGMKALAECRAISATDVSGLVALAQEIKADLVVVGPESALAAGVTDALHAVGIACFGPSKTAAQLESSKAFTKDLCHRAHIPTAGFGTFDEPEPAKAFLKTLSPPYVLKADGLAAGKGVVITEDYAEACDEIDAMMGGRYGAASQCLVIEEFMPGEEASLFAICDSKTAMIFGWAQDHKRAYDGDLGPNTGGMGTYSPARIVTPEVLEFAKKSIIDLTLRQMEADGIPYCGVLYAGLMIEGDRVRLVEYNARFGDPECQVLMLRLQSDIVPYLIAAAHGRLSQMAEPQWSDQASVCVVYAAKGYPEAPKMGSVIGGLSQDFGPDVHIFHAGTRKDPDGTVRANGGRVLNICALADDLKQARDKAYAAIETIDWPDGFYRRDIGLKGL